MITKIKNIALTLLLSLMGHVGSFAYDVEVDGIYYNINASNKTVTVTNNGKNTYSGNIIIPPSILYNEWELQVTSIGMEAFYGCSSLVSVEIPNSVTKIGQSAFMGCSSLVSVEIPNSVTEIELAAFESCRNLESVEIPNSVTEIGGSAFYGCSSLVSVEIPNSVTKIGQSAFSNCSSLVSVEIPNSVTMIGYSSFYCCSSLESVEIPNSVTEIGESAFGDCESLINVIIQDGTDILNFTGNASFAPFHSSNIEKLYLGRNYGGNIFKNQKKFNSISFGKSVTDASSISYKDNANIETLTCYSMVPPKISNFTNLQYANIKVYVPYGTLETYQNADYWKNFWNIEEMEPISNENGVESIYDENTEVNIYAITGILLHENVPSSEVNNLAPGLYIIQSKNGSFKIRK